LRKRKKTTYSCATCFSSARYWCTTTFVRFSTVVLMVSASIVLLVGSGSIAVITALAGVLIGLESRVALKENSASGLRNRGWWTLLYSFWVFGYALSVEFGRPKYISEQFELGSLSFNLSDFALEARCGKELLQEEFSTALQQCEELTTLNVLSLSTLSAFTFLSFWALRQFANDLESRRRISEDEHFSW
jgi:hypothetical protein